MSVHDDRKAKYDGRKNSNHEEVNFGVPVKSDKVASRHSCTKIGHRYSGLLFTGALRCFVMQMGTIMFTLSIVFILCFLNVLCEQYAGAQQEVLRSAKKLVPKADQSLNGQSVNGRSLEEVLRREPNSAASTTSGSRRQFKLALPGYKYNFPRDHASHDEYRTEWWYYTGHLEAEDGRRFGYELTFFRSALDPEKPVSGGNWNVQNVYMTHFAVSDINEKKFNYSQRLTRPGVGFAGADENRYRVFNKDWSAQLGSNQDHLLKAQDDGYAIDLTLKPQKPPAVHGLNGVSQKANCVGCASHYYSFTRMLTTGTVTVNGRALKVRGTSWMDHEFGSNQLTADQVGWDWFSISLDNNKELMLYQMRLKDGGLDSNSSGTIVEANGSTRHLLKSEYKVSTTAQWKSPKTDALYPIAWRVIVPSIAADLTITPLMEDQELAKRTQSQVTYWEGACAVNGTIGGKPVAGQAYVEMTGYHEQFNKKI